MVVELTSNATTNQKNGVHQWTAVGANEEAAEREEGVVGLDGD